MVRNREFSDKPLVALEADKLLGMRQLAQVSTRRADGAARYPGGSAGDAAKSRADMSRLFSKAGAEIPPA